MYYAETHSFDPCYNLAFEEYLLTHKSEGDWLMLWQNKNTVVVGLNQNTSEEINSDFIRNKGITVVRRTTGGGAVYHDLGNLNYSFITDAGSAEEISIEKFSKPVCEALAALGVNASVSGRNDILIDGKKVSGVAQRVYCGRILHHGTLLFRSDTEMISGALNADPEKFSSKSTKSVRSRVGNIADYLPSEMTIADFKAELLRRLSGGGAELYEPSEQELVMIRQAAEEKYRSDSWTYGRDPAYTFRNKRRFSGGTLEVKLLVKDDIIQEAHFAGDFMATSDCHGLERSFQGLAFNRAAVMTLLAEHDLGSIFGGISPEEIVSSFFE